MRTRLLLVVTLIGVAAVATSCGGESGPSLADERVPFLGVNGDVLFYPHALEDNADVLDAQLDQLASASVSFVRSQLEWRRAEPEAPEGAQHRFDWTDHDRWVAALAEHDMRWAPIVLGWPVPEWAADPEGVAAGCGSRATPDDPRDYAAFAAGLTKRYGRDGSFWRENPDLPELPVTSYELWNEPNAGAFWCPAPSPEGFALTAELAAAAIKATDPKAEIVLGGLAPFSDSSDPGRMPAAEFLRRATKASPGLADAIDAVGVHPYAPDAAGALAVLADLRSAIDATPLGGEPMVVNEFGWPSQGTGGFTNIADADSRAAELRTLLEGLFEEREALGITAIAPYTWTSEETDPANQEDWFGMADPATGEPNEVGATFVEESNEIAEAVSG